MRVFITGGAGLIGHAIATHLIERDYEVHLTDLAAETDAPHSTYSVCDIMNFDALCEQMRGSDAVVHMAALRSPLNGPGQDVFRINTAGTFNVFEAAAKVGIRRVVHASSINAIGCAWNTGEFSPRHLPMDEDHPSVTTDPYSLSKALVEEIGAYYWRRDAIASVAFRFPGIYRAAQRQSSGWMEGRRAMCAFLDDFLKLPTAEQQRQMADARQHALAFRAERRLEYPNERFQMPAVEGVDAHLLRAYMMDRFNLWALLDVRDAARAVEQALTVPLNGGHSLFVNSTRNALDYDSLTLARLFFPDVPVRQPLIAAQALVSIQRARDLIGFEPIYSLEDEKNVETR